MLSKEALEAYRRMTPERRLELTCAAIREHEPALHYGDPDVVKRRFALLRNRSDEFNRLVCEKLLKADLSHDFPPANGTGRH